MNLEFSFKQTKNRDRIGKSNYWIADDLKRLLLFLGVIVFLKNSHVLKIRAEGCLAGSVRRACGSLSLGHEFKPRCREYLNKLKKLKKY